MRLSGGGLTGLTESACVCYGLTGAVALGQPVLCPHPRVSRWEALEEATLGLDPAAQELVSALHLHRLHSSQSSSNTSEVMKTGFLEFLPFRMVDHLTNLNHIRTRISNRYHPHFSFNSYMSNCKKE